jgi:DNA-directed RNA polymerase alpha subunit
VKSFEEDDLQIFPQLTEVEMQEILNKPIKDLDISIRTLNALKRTKLLTLITLKDIYLLPEKEIRKIELLGKLGVSEISSSFKDLKIKWPLE